jgi:hypothetical protein
MLEAMVSKIFSLNYDDFGLFFPQKILCMHHTPLYLSPNGETLPHKNGAHDLYIL